MIAHDEWPLVTLANELDVPKVTLYRWAERNLVQARRVETGRRKSWIIQADDNEIKRLRERGRILVGGPPGAQINQHAADFCV